MTEEQAERIIELLNDVLSELNNVNENLIRMRS